jgi:hypothetical protein
VEFRHAVAMFLGAITGVFAWLAWILVVGIVLSAIFGENDPRRGMDPNVVRVISALAIVFLLALPGFISARVGARVAARRTGSMDVARVAFLMTITMEIILVAAFSFMFLAGGGGS